MFLPIRRGHFLPIRRGSNSEESCFCQTRRVIFLPIRKGHIMPMRRGPNSEGVLFLSIRRGPRNIFFNERNRRYSNTYVIENKI